MTPYESFRAADREIVIAVTNEKAWTTLCELPEFAEISRDPRFAAQPLRTENRAALVPAVEAAMMTMPAAYWLATFDPVGIPAEPINTLPEMLEHPQLAHRGMLRRSSIRPAPAIASAPPACRGARSPPRARSEARPTSASTPRKSWPSLRSLPVAKASFIRKASGRAGCPAPRRAHGSIERSGGSVKVLITGGMGVIGAETSRKFVKEGHRPVIFARHRDESLIGDILDKVDIELGDILDMPRILQAIKKHKVTHVVHSAAFVGAVSAANPALSIQVNVMGLVNVLEAARALDVKRVVFTSAKGVYGPIIGEYGHPTYKPMPEDMPKNPKRIYDSAKFMGENVCIYYNDNMGVETVSLRFASHLRARQDRAARTDGGDEPHRREPGAWPAVQARAGRRRQGRLHLQQGLRDRHLSRHHHRKAEEPRVQHRHRRRRHAARLREGHQEAHSERA